jgi:hypothetical protein
MTISNYQEAIAEQSRHIIESNKILKPFLDKIEDLDITYRNNNVKLEMRMMIRVLLSSRTRTVYTFGAIEIL